MSFFSFLKTPAIRNKVIAVVAIAVVIPAAVAFTSISNPSVSQNGDPLEKLLGVSKGDAQFKADLLTTNVVPVLDNEIPSNLNSCITAKKNTYPDYETMSIKAPYNSSAVYSESLTEIQSKIAFFISSAFPSATNANPKINWQWNGTTSTWTFYPYPGQGPIWLCFFENNDIFSKLFRTPSLEQSNNVLAVTPFTVSYATTETDPMKLQFAPQSATVTITAVTDADTYTVQMSNSPLMTNSVSYTLTGTMRTQTLSNLIYNSTYYVRVVAIDNNGRKASSVSTIKPMIIKTNSPSCNALALRTCTIGYSLVPDTQLETNGCPKSPICAAPILPMVPATTAQ